MTSRQTASLGTPPDVRVAIPTIARPAHAWRAHAVRPDSSMGAWWFSCGPNGRFDLEAPKGTCYLASDPETALREQLGPRLAALGLVQESWMAGVAVSLLMLPRGRALADTLHKQAIRIPGLTREIATVVDYPAHPQLGQVLRDERLRRHPVLGTSHDRRG